MKKTNLIFLILLLNISVFISAQDVNVTEDFQKPSKEDFFHSWFSEYITGKSKYFFEITYLNESSYIFTTSFLFTKTKQNYVISKWEEASNIFDYVEEYPYGFKIYAKESNNRSEMIFYIFINNEKTKYLSVNNFGDYRQYYIYTKK